MIIEMDARGSYRNRLCGKQENWTSNLLNTRCICCILICWFIQKCTYIYWINTDTMINDASRKEAGRKTQEDFFRNIFTSLFIARIRKGCWRVACERMLETERKLHILTPLLWPSRCVFLVLLMLGSTPSGGFRGPPRSGVAFLTTSRL